MPRPTKYTQERADIICDLLGKGCTRKEAYESAGVVQTTFLSWLDRFPYFLDMITRAEAVAGNKMACVIFQAAVDGDWRAADTWLTKRRKADWGDKVAVEHTVKAYEVFPGFDPEQV